MKLFIVESPKKCKSLNSFLGNEFKVVASVGHIRSIPRKGLQIDVKNGFEPNYEIIEDKEKVVKEIKELAKKATEIILATDPDREGEAISFAIYDILNNECKKKCKRVTFNSISKNEVLKQLAKPRDIDFNLVSAQKARQVLDRLIGYKISPLLWYSVQSKTSAGRVQSVALKLVVDKEKEIKAFKPETFWYIDASLKAKKGDFVARVVTKDADNRYLDEKLTQKDYDLLKTSKYKVESVDKKEKNVDPYPPFDTASLQIACSSLFSWQSKKTAALAQSLYESGKITYIRSDSFAISEEALKEVRDLISQKENGLYLPSKPYKYEKKSKAAAQEAHECIRPSHVEDNGSSLDGDEHRLYKLIRDRFIACQMKPMVVNTVSVNIETDSGKKLVAKGKTVKFEGWKKIYNYSKSEDLILPDVEVNEKLILLGLDKSEHETQPPQRFNEGSLIKKLEADGIGRPSTYASIMDSIQQRGYMESMNKKGSLQATDLGIKIVDYLDNYFNKSFMDIKFTADMEDNLNDIAEGKKTFLDIVQAAYDILLDEISKTKQNGEEGKKSSGISMDVPCSKCKSGTIVEKSGKFGTFYCCDQYPKCKSIFYKNDDGTFSEKKGSKSKSTGVACPKCLENGRKGTMMERTNKKDGSKFLGCSNYPECRHSESTKK